MWNKELYVREQQDAYEFFTSLVDQLDEHLKVIQTSTVVKVSAQNLEALVFVIMSLIMKLFLEQKMGREQIFKNTFQGIYSDQKICKDCPHRYIEHVLSSSLTHFDSHKIFYITFNDFPTGMSVKKHSWL